MRVGIISTARIARKNWGAIRDSGNVVVAVSSRDVTKAQSFIDELQASQPFPTAPVALGSHDELLQMPAVDALYIPVPMVPRFDICLRALELGKHVVCEKPVAGSMEQTERLLAAARAHNCVFLDGSMFSHGARLRAVREILLADVVLAGAESSVTTSAAAGSAGGGAAASSDSTHNQNQEENNNNNNNSSKKRLGVPKSATSSFTFPGGDAMMNPNTTEIRALPTGDFLGALGDIAHYCIRYTIEALSRTDGKTRVSRVLRARGDNVLLGGQGVNVSFAGAVEFQVDVCSSSSSNNENNAATAATSSSSSFTFFLQFYVSMNEGHQQNISFRGDGPLTLDVDGDFCLPFLDERCTRLRTHEHDIVDRGGRLDHNKASSIVEVAETSWAQEEHLWRNLASVVKALCGEGNNNNQQQNNNENEEEIVENRNNNSAATLSREEAQRLRCYWQDVLRLGQQAVTMCYESAQNRDGAWVRA